MITLRYYRIYHKGSGLDTCLPGYSLRRLYTSYSKHSMTVCGELEVCSCVEGRLNLKGSCKTLISDLWDSGQLTVERYKSMGDYVWERSSGRHRLPQPTHMRDRHTISTEADDICPYL